MAIDPPARRPWLNVRVTIEAVSSAEGVSVGEVTMQGINGGQPLTAQIPICAPPPATSDGWPVEPAAFGRALREAREVAKLSQGRLARIAGVTEATVRNIEEGRVTASPAVRQYLLMALAKADASPA